MKNTRHLLGLILLLLSLITMPSAYADQPAWVKGDAAEYPNDQYLVGRGVGATEEEAKNRARGDLAAIFEVRIQVVSANTISVTQSDKKAQVSKVATQQVSAKTDKVISGVEIAKTWRDPVSKDFYALAVLSRPKAAAGLREELSKIDDAVQQQMDAAKKENDPLLKIGAMAHALEVSIKRDGFQASLQVVNPSGHGVDAPIPQAEIQAAISDALKQVRIAPQVADGTQEAAFPGILKGGLAAAGFLANDAANADFLLVGKLALTDLGRRSNWNWVRATVEVSLLEKATGRVRGSKTWPVKASAQDADTARARALIEVERLFKDELRSAIIGFAGS